MSLLLIKIALDILPSSVRQKKEKEKKNTDLKGKFKKKFFHIWHTHLFRFYFYIFEKKQVITDVFKIHISQLFPHVPAISNWNLKLKSHHCLY